MKEIDWVSLGNDRPNPRLTDEQLAELARRDAELDKNPEIAMSWQQIRDSVEKKRESMSGSGLGLC
jgi:putative addiction module component (TIGR02574 family)